MGDGVDWKCEGVGRNLPSPHTRPFWTMRHSLICLEHPPHNRQYCGLFCDAVFCRFDPASRSWPFSFMFLNSVSMSCILT
ncbi:hypothetical protein K470DRAFT_144994 [Piedraia hortae CBS 480.64]|uniref:Uncharacterized protein n=1 Tax=Piedraia hortae CBS 480.64 TaxID=1314780 RepID=A0A6A7BS62_9PEZI|nr:hypothetical protein K470DRAFT_144994 [Piedraia hortae CBS 480.64]